MRPSLSFISSDILLESMSSFIGNMTYGGAVGLMDWLFNQDGLAADWLVDDAFQDISGNWYYQSRPLLTKEEESSLKTLLLNVYNELVTLMAQFHGRELLAIYHDGLMLYLEIRMSQKIFIVYCANEMEIFRNALLSIQIGNKSFMPHWENDLAMRSVAALCRAPFGVNIEDSIKNNVSFYAMPEITHITSILTPQQAAILHNAMGDLAKSIFYKMYFMKSFGDNPDIQQFQNWTFPYLVFEIRADSFYFYF